MQKNCQYPSAYLNEDTLHVLYVDPENVKIAIKFIGNIWLKKLYGIYEPDRYNKTSRIIALINNNAFHCALPDANIQEQKWFIQNMIL